MKVKMILPALTEATSPFFRPIKYSLFPPLGLATLAGYLDDDDEVEIQDEHVERLDLDDDARPRGDPGLHHLGLPRVSRSPITTARRGAYVVLGGLHVTSLPDEAAAHADTIFLGPGEDTWPRFLADFRAAARRASTSRRCGRSPALPPHPARPDQAPPLSGAELDRRLARLPARLRLLLQGGVLRRRHGRSTRRPSTTRSPRSSGCPAGTCTSSTTICSATAASPRRCSTACAAWGVSGRPPAR